ncbi:unnamed protein product [Urochloa humidicola]
MAHDGPHGHHDTSSSSERRSAPPKTMNLLGAAVTDNGGSKIDGSPVSMDASKGKEVIPNTINGEEHGSPSRSEGKNLALGLAANADTAPGDGSTKGKSPMAADDDGKLKVQLIMDRERRRQMKDMFSALQDLMPHVPKKVDKATLVGATINYIKALEQTKANLERKKQERDLARLAAATAKPAGASLPVARTAHGMAALSDGWGPALPQQHAAPAAAPPPRGPDGFQTWSTPKVVLSVLGNNEAVINVCVPRQPHMLTLVLSVLSKYRIEVISMQVGADGAGSLFAIYTRVNGAGGENPSAENIYKLAMSEIMVWLST